MVLWARWQPSFDDQDDTRSSVPRMSQNRRDQAPGQSVTEYQGLAHN